MKTTGLKIGDIIYSYNSPKILEYKIIEIQHFETKKHKEKFFILECQVCRDHTPCKVATKINNSGNLEYSHMINNYDEEEFNEYSKNNQYYWHTGDCFFRTRTEARLHIHNKNITYYKSNIQKAQESIAYNEKCINEEQDKITALTELTPANQRNKNI